MTWKMAMIDSEMSISFFSRILLTAKLITHFCHLFVVTRRQNEFISKNSELWLLKNRIFPKIRQKVKIICHFLFG